MAGPCTPGSWKTLRDAAGDLRKVIGHILGRKRAMVDAWMLPPPMDAVTRDANGSPNPLDHVVAVHQIVASDSPDRADKMLDWLCRECGGRFVRPPDGQLSLYRDPDQAVEAVRTLAAEPAAIPDIPPLGGGPDQEAAQ